MFAPLLHEVRITPRLLNDQIQGIFIHFPYAGIYTVIRQFTVIL